MKIKHNSTIKIDRQRVDALMMRVGILTYNELAQKSGIHSNTLVRILQGDGWQSNTLEDIAVALQCSPLDLVVASGFATPSLGDPGQPLPEEQVVK